MTLLNGLPNNNSRSQRRLKILDPHTSWPSNENRLHSQVSSQVVSIVLLWLQSTRDPTGQPLYSYSFFLHYFCCLQPLQTSFLSPSVFLHYHIPFCTCLYEIFADRISSTSTAVFLLWPKTPLKYYHAFKRISSIYSHYFVLRAILPAYLFVLTQQHASPVQLLLFDITEFCRTNC